jgi:hypothetical protein
MSQPAFVYRLRPALEDWVAVVERVHQTHPFSFIYWETAATIRLEAYQPPSPLWPEGRAFGPQLELRWIKRRDGRVDLTLLGETQFSNEDAWEACPELTGLVVGDDNALSQVLLLGVSRRHERSPYQPVSSDAPKAWTDSRLPQPLLYPVEDTQSQKRWVKVKTKIYRLNERPVLTRLVALEGTSDETPL